MTQPLLEMKNITKSFGPVKALDHVSIKLFQGEIHALLGENGAGKSTLMSVLSGTYSPEEGEIFYNGKPVKIKSPKQSVELGIGMVHQHFQLIQTLTVAENIISYSDSLSFILNQKKMNQEVEKCSKEFGLSLDPKAKIWQLSVGEQQRVEIIKLLYRGMDILILDEPSAVLTPQESEEMYKTLRKMAESGKSIIVISHKMNEVMNHADRITVLKGGCVEDTLTAQEATVERLTAGVIGNKKTRELVRETNKKSQEQVLKVEQIGVRNDKGLMAIDNVNFEIAKGEILGIAGVAGNGQKELAEALAGLRKITSGEIALNNISIQSMNARKRRSLGISFIPEDRLKTGLVPSLGIKENLILKDYKQTEYSNRGILKWKKISSKAKEKVKEYNIKNGGLDQAVSLMSGGNQQKLLIAREIAGTSKLIIAANPVRGLDIGAAEDINAILLEQRKSGAAILYISDELEVLFQMSDKIGVLCDNRLVTVKKTEDTSYDEIGRLMTGEKKHENSH